MRRLLAAAALALCASCAGVPGPGQPPAGRDARAAREVLVRFVQAVEAERWEEALALTSARWRWSYTPAKLALDWKGAGAGGREQVARVGQRLAAGAALEVVNGSARLPVGDGTAAVLVPEAAGWRVDALDAAER